MLPENYITNLDSFLKSLANLSETLLKQMLIDIRNDIERKSNNTIKVLNFKLELIHNVVLEKIMSSHGYNLWKNNWKLIEKEEKMGIIYYKISSINPESSLFYIVESELLKSYNFKIELIVDLSDQLNKNYKSIRLQKYKILDMEINPESRNIIINHNLLEQFGEKYTDILPKLWKCNSIPCKELPIKIEKKISKEIEEKPIVIEKVEEIPIEIEKRKFELQFVLKSTNEKLLALKILTVYESDYDKALIYYTKTESSKVYYQSYIISFYKPDHPDVKQFLNMKPNSPQFFIFDNLTDAVKYCITEIRKFNKSNTPKLNINQKVNELELIFQSEENLVGKIVEGFSFPSELDLDFDHSNVKPIDKFKQKELKSYEKSIYDDINTLNQLPNSTFKRIIQFFTIETRTLDVQYYTLKFSSKDIPYREERIKLTDEILKKEFNVKIREMTKEEWMQISINESKKKKLNESEQELYNSFINSLSNIETIANEEVRFSSKTTIETWRLYYSRSFELEDMGINIIRDDSNIIRIDYNYNTLETRTLIELENQNIGISIEEASKYLSSEELMNQYYPLDLEITINGKIKEYNGNINSIKIFKTKNKEAQDLFPKFIDNLLQKNEILKQEIDKLTIQFDKSKKEMNDKISEQKKLAYVKEGSESSIEMDLHFLINLIKLIKIPKSNSSLFFEINPLNLIIKSRISSGLYFKIKLTFKEELISLFIPKTVINDSKVIEYDIIDLLKIVDMIPKTMDNIKISFKENSTEFLNIDQTKSKFKMTINHEMFDNKKYLDLNKEIDDLEKNNSLNERFVELNRKQFEDYTVPLNNKDLDDYCEVNLLSPKEKFFSIKYSYSYSKNEITKIFDLNLNNSQFKYDENVNRKYPAHLLSKLLKNIIDVKFDKIRFSQSNKTYFGIFDLRYEKNSFINAYIIESGNLEDISEEKSDYE